MSSSDSIQSHVRIATGLSLTIATVSVILRCIARRLLGQRLFWDDILISIALVFEWGIGIAGLLLLQHGLGIHVDHVKPEDLVIYMKVLYAGAPLYALTIVSIKLSLLALYYRLFPVKHMIYCCLVVGAIVVAWGLATTITGLFLCNPIRKLWNPELPGQCLDLGQFYYGIQIPNILTDIAILVLPIKSICMLDISGREKAQLGAIFGLGVLVLVFDIVRLIVMIELSQSGLDVTWNEVATSVWTCVEPAVAISIACLVHLRPILKCVKEYWNLGMYPRSGIPSTHGNHLSSVGSTSSIINGNQTNVMTEKGLSENGVEFKATTGTSLHSAAEAGLLKHDMHGASRSTTSSRGNDASADFEAPSFPTIVDLLSEIRPSDIMEICPIPTPTSSIDGGPGPALRSTTPFAKRGSPVAEAKNERKNVNNTGSTQTRDQTAQPAESDFWLRSEVSQHASGQKPLPFLP